MRVWESVAFAAVLAAAPLAAQSTNEATPVPAPTPPPAPAGDAVGPPQLRDFNLNGTVTQPAQPATPTPTPSPAQRPPAASATEPRATPAPAPVVAAPGRATPAPRLPTIAAPDTTPSQGAIDLPPPSAAPDSPVARGAPVEADPVAPAADAPGSTWWPWLAALLAIALGAGLLWWRRQQHSSERYAADDAALAALVAAPDASPVLPRASSSPPRPAPRVPFPAPAPAAAPVPAPVPTPAPAPPAQPPLPDGIFASRLKPQLEFELVPIRAETDADAGAALTFDLIVINRGSAPARDVLIEAQLINAGPQVDAEVGRFFMQPGGTGERLPMIPPMGRVSIKTRLAVAGDSLAPLVVEGRKLLVPLIAINALYRWSGGELKDSSSFLVGRGEAEGGKMAPFRLDRGARSWSGLAARLHSTGLEH